MSEVSFQPTPMATWNPARGVWETDGTNLFCEHSELYSATWPASGSMRSGRCFERPTSAPRTVGSASSSSAGPLLKTPTSQLAVNGGSQHPDKRKAGGHGPTLADEVEHLLPTPAARDWKSGESNIMDRNSRPLNEAVVNLLPTPRASDTGTPGRRASEGFRPPLSQVVLPLLPAPRATDGAHGGPNQRGSKGDFALPAAAHRIGVPTVPPSPDGSPPSDGQHLGQLTIADD